MNEKATHLIIDSMPMAHTSWVDILSALLVPVVAVIGVYIACQQYRINVQRLRHETYQRRLKVYKTVQVYLSEVMRDGNSTYDRALKFVSDAAEAAFLFDSSVQEKIDEIYKKSIQMIALEERMHPSDGSQGLPVGEERSQVAQEASELLMWHTNQLVESRLFFAKKLGLNFR